ncbi:G-type lectin S-receptor-like serine/threonine-protein kinase SD2-5 [Bidens hawaiensis]|uniref:G-type lectin S-receptor-like serine/threonine-protein kinase SD2-5 n=1 Tax=Bidens hawaiensis TaxID=980011 RepID=UPI004049659C
MCYCIFLFFIFNWYSITAQPPFDYPTANLSTTWENNESLPHSANFTDGSRVRAILLRGFVGPNFACGFYCSGTCTSYLFAIFIVQTNSGGGITLPASGFPQVVWSANRDYPVSDGAILNFTATGELVLQDADGSTVWTTNTTGRSIAGLNLTDDGNLVLFDDNSSVVWQSFDYPTDCLVLGQRLYQGQQLIPSVSSTNWTAQKGLFSLQVTNKGLFAYVGSNPPQAYYSLPVSGKDKHKGRRYVSLCQMGIWSTNWTAQKGLFSLQVTNKGLFAYVGSNPPQAYYSLPVSGKDKHKGRRYVRFLNGSLSLFILSTEPSDPDDDLFIPKASSVQYMKFMPNGHLKVFEWETRWLVVADLFTNDARRALGECDYPLACGRNALCSGNRQCSCPVSASSPRIDYFKAVNDQEPDQGCYETTPLTCSDTKLQTFIALENVMYLNSIVDMKSVDIDTCKQACIKNCTCKAALFQYGSNSSSGECSLHFELFTLKSVEPNVVHCNASAFVKVQSVRSPPLASTSRSFLSNLGVMLTSVIGSVLLVLGVAGFLLYAIRKRRWDVRMEEESIGEVPGMSNRFSYEELKNATENFIKKLGEGGFGAVFEGTLDDGSKIAVKRLDGLGQVNKSFLAEVESIGSIHHVNLVTLRGFGAWKSQRFLVYEFMSNGSLDRWIYHEDRKHELEWDCIKRIILDVAKGLAYLHEECRQKIIHLDIKPQNILLDSNFNAKVSDFGLSKLIDRNQSQVMTTMRGTPGYLAPEWLSSVITEKVDVYSFGIVVLEMLCGRKNFDKSQPEESWHLLSVFQKCWEQGMLLDMVDKYSKDMQIHSLEVVEIMKLASWCLQYDYTKRPSMSMVVKVLEGVMKVESCLDYNFTYLSPQNTEGEQEKDMTPLLDFVLSNPR